MVRKLLRSLAKKVDKIEEKITTNKSKKKTEFLPHKVDEKTKRKKPTGFDFKRKYQTDIGRKNPTEDKIRDISQRKLKGSGKAADAGPDPIVIGTKSMPSFTDVMSAGSRKRAKLVAELEKFSTRGKTTAIREKAKTILNRLDKASAKAEESRVMKSAIGRSGTKKIEAGEYVNKETGEVIKVTGKEISPVKLKGGINAYFRNPTKLQMEQVRRNIKARERIKDTPEAKKDSKRLSLFARETTKKPNKKNK